MYTYELHRQLSAADESAIDAFLHTVGGFQYFQSPVYFRVCQASEKLQPVYVLAQKAGQLVGVLLACRQVQLGGPAGFLTSRTVLIGGPVTDRNSPELADGLLKTFLSRGPKSLYTQVRNLSDTSPLKLCFEKNGFGYEEHLNILVDLTQSEETLWKEVHSKRRNEIRRAEKEGCRVVRQTTSEALTDCYAILTDVYRRAKLPLPVFGHFKDMLDQTTATTGLRIFTAMADEKIIGCMLCIAWNNTLYDYYAGAFSRYYHKYPNDLLPWEVFRWAKSEGFTGFDFGGAGKPGVPYGVRDYKKKFGGTMVNYGRYERVHFPALYRMATAGFTLWQRLKR
ncbi:lipid II:glycine glycyltransferase FemX [Spirosoma aerophilum]